MINTRTQLLAALALALVTAAAAGCAAPAAYLTAPASDADLKTDGSVAAVKKVHDKYSLVVVDETSLWRGQAIGVRNGDGSGLVPINDRNVVEVLAHDADAGVAINNWSFGMSALGSSSRVIFIVGGALTGATVGWGAAPPVANNDAIDVTGPVIGAIAGTLASSSFLLAADALAGGQARVSLADAVAAYNRNLDVRIAKATQPATQPAATPAPTPAATPAP